MKPKEPPYTCNKCGVVLTEGNWPTYRRGPRHGGTRRHGSDFRCMSCTNAYHRQITLAWRRSPNGVVSAAKARDRMRLRHLAVRDENGRQSNLLVEGKRVYADHCEICEATPKRLVYHHWDDSDYSKGLWICQGCHNVVHTEEDKAHITQRYLLLKSSMSGAA